MLIDKYFKLERAWEEIHRLNIEIRRVITYIIRLYMRRGYLPSVEGIGIEGDKPHYSTPHPKASVGEGTLQQTALVLV